MDDATTGAKRPGRPARHLLGGIAVCGVCDAFVRVGSQNTGARTHERSRYRVYECAGSPGKTGYHVSIRQEHLDQLVINTVIARILQPDFQTPRARQEDADGAERQALRFEIKRHRIWLDTVAKESRRRGMEYVLIGQERIVLPWIATAQARIDELERRHPLIDDLKNARPVQLAWDRLSVAQQRQIVQALMVPRINPVPAEERGQRGPNTRRVEIQWLSMD